MVDEPGNSCPNCGASPVGAYCPECGQEQRDTRVSLGRWLAELFDEFALNARVPRTLWLLVVRPGFLSAEWRAGRRARYVTPLRIYILASVVFFGVTFFVGLPINRELPDVGLGDLGVDIAPSGQQLATDAISRRMQGFLTLGAALSVPLLAIWLRVLRRRTGLLFVDHLVFSMHVHSLGLLALTAAYVALFFGIPGYVASAALAACTLGYWIVAWWRTYGWAGRRGRTFASLLGTAAGWGFIGLALLVGEVALFGTMLGSSTDVATYDLATGTYPRARAAFYAEEVERARHLGEVSANAFASVDSADLTEHLPFHAAEAHRFAGRHADARDRAERLIAADSTDLLAIGLAGASAEALGDSTGARRHYERLLDLLDRGVEYASGHAPLQVRYPHAARRFLGRVTPEDLRETAHRRYLRAVALAADGDTARARAVARDALDAYAVEGAVLLEEDALHRAELLALDGRHGEALDRLAAFLGEQPDHMLAHGLAGEAALALGDSAAADLHFTRTLDLLDDGAESFSERESELERVEEAARAFTGRAGTGPA